MSCAGFAISWKFSNCERRLVYPVQSSLFLDDIHHVGLFVPLSRSVRKDPSIIHEQQVMADHYPRKETRFYQHSQFLRKTCAYFRGALKEHQSLSCDSRLEISQKSPTSIANSGTGTRIYTLKLKHPLIPSIIQKLVGLVASLRISHVGVLSQNCQTVEI